MPALNPPRIGRIRLKKWPTAFVDQIMSSLVLLLQLPQHRPSWADPVTAAD